MIITVALAADGESRFARGRFESLPWTSAADLVRRLRIPPRCWERAMLGSSQITRPRTSVAVSAPGAGTADDQDLAATGRWRQAIFAMVIGQTR